MATRNEAIGPEEYDAPFFKVLARNDTGETRSHQAGLVIPKTLSAYFPHLVVGSGPTSDHDITADLYDGPRFIGTIQTRYQIQTWGGTRSPEHRLTRNLRPILELSSAGDVLTFERKLGETDHYKLTLLHQGTSEHSSMLAHVNRNYGVLTARRPANQADFIAAAESIKADLVRPFVPIEEVRKTLTVVQRRVRVELFKRDVRLAYRNACVLCKLSLRTPSGEVEVEAAHIIPFRINGSNDPRNGIALCQSHHWAFDNHLWTLTAQRRVFIPTAVQKVSGNRSLIDFAGQQITEPSPSTLLPAAVALEHHHTATIQRWGQ